MKTLVLNGWAASPHAWDLCRFHRDELFSYVDQLDGRADAYLESCLEPVTLVGWSMGGSTALRLYLKFTEKIAKLVLIAATPRMMQGEGWRGMSDHRLQALQVGLKMTHGEGFFGVEPGKPNPYMMDTDENLERGLEYLKSTDLRSALVKMRDSAGSVPRVLIFQSERDGLVRSSNANFLKSVFPEAIVRLIPGAEHALPVSIPELIDEVLYKNDYKTL